MARIVTTTYRYKPPPKRKGRKLAKITGPAVVTAKGSRRPGPLRGGEQAAAEVEEYACARPSVGDIKSSMPPGNGFCHVSRRLQRVARPESPDYAICMMPIAMRACWRK